MTGHEDEDQPVRQVPASAYTSGSFSLRAQDLEHFPGEREEHGWPRLVTFAADSVKVVIHPGGGSSPSLRLPIDR